jgi:hypothetical protein
MRTGSGTQKGSVHPSATPIAAAAPDRAAVHDRHERGKREGDALAFDDVGSVETAREHHAVKRGYPGDDAVQHGVFPEGSRVAKVAANGSINSGRCRPKRIPAPATAARMASSATHHQS